MQKTRQDAIRLSTRLIAVMLVTLKVLSCHAASGNLITSPATPASGNPSSNTASGTDMNSDKDEEVARIVLGILSYTRWQPPKTAIQLCIVAPTRYTTALEGTTVLDKTLKIEVSKPDYNPAILGSECDVIYFGDIPPIQQQKVIESKTHPLLTISEFNPSCEVGSAFCLDADSTPITFKVNLDALGRGAVHVNPNVLLLGRKKKMGP